MQTKSIKAGVLDVTYREYGSQRWVAVHSRARIPV